jgi:hypothetical protein
VKKNYGKVFLDLSKINQTQSDHKQKKTTFFTNFFSFSQNGHILNVRNRISQKTFGIFNFLKKGTEEKALKV